jgi:signal transduction histidine kinase
MHDIPPGVPEDQYFVLSDLPPSPGQKRLALGIVLGLMAALYLVVGVFGGIQLGTNYSFVAVYTTGMFVTDLITAILLYAQFSILRSRAILVIASGYLFTAFLIVPYVLAFPDVLAPNGVVGGLADDGVPVPSMALRVPTVCDRLYLVEGRGPEQTLCSRGGAFSDPPECRLDGSGRGGARIAVHSRHCVLPRIMVDRYRFVPEWPYLVAAPILALCSLALVVLWSRRRSILDFFLMVVLCAYLIEIPPQYYPVMARFSTGWYAVRISSLLSSTIVLVVLLYEITALYGGLLTAVLRHRREREARLMTGDAVAASIVHEVKQPLTAMVTSADAGFRFLDRSAPDLDRARDLFKRIATDGHRAGEVVESIRANFKTDGHTRTSLHVNELIDEALSLERGDLQKHRILVQAETARSCRRSEAIEFSCSRCWST